MQRLRPRFPHFRLSRRRRHTYILMDINELTSLTALATRCHSRARLTRPSAERRNPLFHSRLQRRRRRKGKRSIIMRGAISFMCALPHWGGGRGAIQGRWSTRGAQQVWLIFRALDQWMKIIIIIAGCARQVVHRRLHGALPKRIDETNAIEWISVWVRVTLCTLLFYSFAQQEKTCDLSVHSQNNWCKVIWKLSFYCRTDLNGRRTGSSGFGPSYFIHLQWMRSAIEW